MLQSKMTCLFDTTSKNYWTSFPNGFSSSSYNKMALHSALILTRSGQAIIQIIHLIYKEFLRKSLSLHVPK